MVQRGNGRIGERDGDPRKSVHGIRGSTDGSYHATECDDERTGHGDSGFQRGGERTILVQHIVELSEADHDQPEQGSRDGA